MNKFMIETELDGLGRPVRSKRVYLHTFEEFMRKVCAGVKMQRMLAAAITTDDDVAVRVFTAELSS